MSKPLRVGLIGCGVIGRKRAGALGRDRLVGCYDIAEAAATSLAADFGAAAVDSLEGLLVLDCDVVVVAVTHDHLADSSCRALESGAHVLVEKPGGVGVADVDRIRAASERAERRVKVGFNHRFHPGIRRAADEALSGDHGDVMFVRARYGHGGRPGYEHEWRADPRVSGGGELVDQGMHLLDLSHWLVGVLPLHSTLLRTQYWQADVEDNAVIVLGRGDRRDERWCAFHVSWTEWKNMFSLEIYCRTAKLEVTGLTGSYGPQRLTLYRMRPELGPPDVEEFDYAESDASWELEWAHFADALRAEDDRPLLGDLTSLRYGWEIIEAAYAQAQLRHSPVDGGAMTNLSVVIPTYNERGNVPRVYERLSATLDGADLDWEIIFSVDPSIDGTEQAILALHERDSRVKMLRFSRRFGQPAATLAGMSAAAGDAVVVIDCDLQDPPELIAQMVERWREGFDVVYAQRRTRKGETLAKRVVSAVGYRLIRRIADVDIPPNTGDFRLMSRRVVDNVVALDEAHGFLRGLVAVVGFPHTSVIYDREARAIGKGKYNRFLGSLVIGFNGIVGFSRYPLHVISLMGVALSFLAGGFAFAYFLSKLAGFPFPTGNPTIVILVSFFAGIQLLSLGVTGEYVGRIYDEVKHRPRYIVESHVGFDERGVSLRDRASRSVSDD